MKYENKNSTFKVLSYFNSEKQILLSNSEVSSSSVGLVGKGSVFETTLEFLGSSFYSLKNSLSTFSKVGSNYVLDIPVSGLFYQDMAIDLSYINTQLIVMVILASVLYYLSKILSKKIFNLDKKSAYECGFEPFLILTTFIEVGFILVAFIFLIFDLELIFLSAFLFSSGTIGSFGILIVLSYLISVWVMVFFEVFSGVLSWPVWS